jgi:hypothetical protein
MRKSRAFDEIHSQKRFVLQEEIRSGALPRKALKQTFHRWQRGCDPYNRYALFSIILPIFP